MKPLSPEVCNGIYLYIIVFWSTWLGSFYIVETRNIVWVFYIYLSLVIWQCMFLLFQVYVIQWGMMLKGRQFYFSLNMITEKRVTFLHSNTCNKFCTKMVNENMILYFYMKLKNWWVFHYMKETTEIYVLLINDVALFF